MKQTHYRVYLCDDKTDDIDAGNIKGGVQVVSGLKFDGDDYGLPFDTKVENETLAMRILLQNMDEVELPIFENGEIEGRVIGDTQIVIENEDNFRRIIQGKYPKVLVSKYMK